MQILRRRGNKLFKKIALLGLAIAISVWIRHTQGALLLEIYHGINLPFISFESQQPEILTNARIKELEIRLQELEKQNQNLKNLLDYSQTKKLQGVVAPVVGRSADNWWKQLTLGRGSNDGIEEGFFVTGAGGLLGQVISVTPHTSRVLLISDPKSKVGVGIVRSRQMGFMRGQSENYAVMEFFDDVPDVKEGDLVSTSAYSQLFPPGIPVGIVESVDLSKTPAPEAIIKFSVPFNSIEWAIVYPYKASKN